MVAAVALLVLCVAVAGALQHVALDQALGAADIVERVQSMRLASERLRRSVSDALALAAGSALGGSQPDRRFDSARDAVRERLQALESLASDDPEQRGLISRVRDAVGLAQAGLSDGPAATHHPPDSLARTLREDGLRARLQAVGDALDALESYEQRLLARRRDLLGRDRTRTELALIGGNAVALCAILAVFGLAMHARLVAECRSMRRRVDGIVRNMTEGFMLLDRDWRIRYANDRAAELLGRTRAKLVGGELWALFPDALDSAFGRAARQVAANGTAARVEDFFPKWHRWVESHVYPSDDGVVVMFQDTTRSRDDQRLLVEREQLLTDLSRRLLRAQEDERRAIARELHDHLLQEMVAWKLSLAAARREPDRDRRNAQLDWALTVCDTLIAQLRGRALDLHPAILEDLGLTAAVDWLCERQRALTDTRIVLEPGGPVPRLARETEAAAFRIVQEALSNAIRHAQARCVRVCITTDDAWLRLIVADDGVGMDTAERDATRRGTLGLVSMRERAALLGGRLTIDSVPGRGTTLEASLPT